MCSKEDRRLGRKMPSHGMGMRGKGMVGDALAILLIAKPPTS